MFTKEEIEKVVKGYEEMPDFTKYQMYYFLLGYLAYLNDPIRYNNPYNGKRRESFCLGWNEAKEDA